MKFRLATLILAVSVFAIGLGSYIGISNHRKRFVGEWTTDNYTSSFLFNPDGTFFYFDSYTHDREGTWRQNVDGSITLRFEGAVPTARHAIINNQGDLTLTGSSAPNLQTTFRRAE